MKELLFAIAKTGGGSLITMALGAIMVKIIAVIGGTSGIGLWSIIKQMQQTGVMIGSANGNTSLVRGIGALDGGVKFRFMKTVMSIFFVSGLLVTSVLVLCSHSIAAWLKNIPDYIVMLMAIPICMGIARSYVQGCLNGFREIGHLAKSQIFGAGAGALFAFPIALWVRDGHSSGFVWLATMTAAASFFSAVYYMKKNEGIFTRVWNASGWDAGAAKEFLSIAGALSVTGAFGIFTMFAVKTIIVRNGGLEDVGLFDASWVLGAMYVSLLLGSFGTYVLPKLSSLEEADQAAFIQRVTKLTAMMSIPLVVMVICIKPVVISVFYSGDFLSTMEMFRWMLIGDYLKMSGWVFAMVLIANRYIGALILSSVLWDVGLLLSTWLCYRLDMGLELIGFSIMALHASALVVYYLYVQKRVEFILSLRVFMIWLSGLILVILASVVNWDLHAVHWGASAMLFVTACVISLTALETHDRLAIGKMLKGWLSK